MQPSGSQVNWMAKSDQDPYAGVAKHMMSAKNTAKMYSDSYVEVIGTYNAVRTLLKVSRYHGDGLMPNWKLMANDVDLTKTPIWEKCMPIPKLAWSTPGHWNDAH